MEQYYKGCVMKLEGLIQKLTIEMIQFYYRRKL